MARLLALASLLATATVAPAPSVGQCRELGFSDMLVCSRCDKLEDFLSKGDPLLAECRDCCTQDDSESSTYSKIVLEVCQ